MWQGSGQQILNTQKISGQMRTKDVIIIFFKKKKKTCTYIEHGLSEVSTVSGILVQALESIGTAKVM